MKSAIQCIVLLACIAICTSNPVGRCRCIKTIPAVRSSLIADIKVNEPSPACHEREVIVVRKDNKEFCLNPESNFTKRLLMAMQKNAEGNLSTTTAAATTLEALRSQPPEPAEEVDLLTWLTWDPTAN
ncbi:growth-regulated alpha protein-like isoform X4 [Poecilia reticulata]|uniref:growth-regulated alpha protein-like isoform X4 n=1 Tax=Poecilia reticulata TaxID=8081 RepID=UPI0007EA21C5|nr:PREDICTED: growth-regulated alpha protein-like isoform X4 [Poecilia reticulata]